MPLPNTGPLSASQINVELTRAAGALFSLNDAAVRTLAGKASGTISFSDLLGKSFEVYAQFTLTVGYSPAGTYTDSKMGWVTYYPEQRGFSTYSAFGSASPNVVRGARVTYLLETHGTTGGTVGGTARDDSFMFSADGFSADPGAAWMKRIEVFSGATRVLLLDASAATYTFTPSGSPPFAHWKWQLPQAWHLGQSGAYTVRVYYMP